MFCQRITLVLYLALAAWCISPAAAQVMRLPPVLPAEESFPGRLVSHPDSPSNLLQAPGQLSPAEEPERPPDARPGMFQKLIFTTTWLAAGRGHRDMGITDVELKTVLAFPIPSRTYPLIVTPGVALHYMDGPVVRDVPARLYDGYIQFRWMRRVTPRLGIDLAVTPGVYSDFEQESDEAIRITGHAVAAWTWTPVLKVVLGASYLDRDDVPGLPIVGLVWEPHDDVKYELVFPHPRIARRIYHACAMTDDVQDWIYLAGELGGGTWAIERTDGSDDVLNYLDYRIYVGLEHKAIGRLDYRLEAGYVFGRKIEYLSATPDFEPPDTVMLRGGVTY